MRGKNFTTPERDIIRLLLLQKKSIGQIAIVLGRSKSGTHGQIKRMIADGSIDQDILDLGQVDANQK